MTPHRWLLYWLADAAGMAAIVLGVGLAAVAVWFAYTCLWGWLHAPEETGAPRPGWWYRVFVAVRNWRQRRKAARKRTPATTAIGRSA